MLRNEARQKPKPNRVPHGTLGGYTNQRCRCARCRKAMRLYMRDYRERRDAREKDAA